MELQQHFPTQELQGAFPANSKKLFNFLKINSKHTDWIKNRIKQYGFIENQDYIKTIRKVGNATAYDYFITLDMAKELCMVENNEKGRQARRYFIACEKELKRLSHYQLERENIELRRAINRLTENNNLFGSALTEHHFLDFISFLSKTTETLKLMSDYADQQSKHADFFLGKLRERFKDKENVQSLSKSKPGIKFGAIIDGEYHWLILPKHQEYRQGRG